MTKAHTFQQIIHDVKQTLQAARPVSTCPTSDALLDFVYQGIQGQAANEMSTHIESCDACQMMVMRMEADLLLWNETLEQSTETALSQALGVAGRQKVRSQIRQTREKQIAGQSSFLSKIKESMVAWASPLWQPLYAGEAVTAAAAEEQSTRFEMDYGEYINLRCHWQDEKNNQPSINLSWQANLLQPSKLWARFINPDTSMVITEILLGSKLEGTLRIPGSELSFNPAVDKWAIAIVVEEE